LTTIRDECPTVYDGPQTVREGWRANEATVRFSAWTGRGQPTPKAGPTKRTWRYVPLRRPWPLSRG